MRDEIIMDLDNKPNESPGGTLSMCTSPRVAGWSPNIGMERHGMVI